MAHVHHLTEHERRRRRLDFWVTVVIVLVLIALAALVLVLILDDSTGNSSGAAGTVLGRLSGA